MGPAATVPAKRGRQLLLITLWCDHRLSVWSSWQALPGRYGVVHCSDRSNSVSSPMLQLQCRIGSATCSVDMTECSAAHVRASRVCCLAGLGRLPQQLAMWTDMLVACRSRRNTPIQPSSHALQASCIAPRTSATDLKPRDTGLRLFDSPTRPPRTPIARHSPAPPSLQHLTPSSERPSPDQVNSLSYP